MCRARSFKSWGLWQSKLKLSLKSLKESKNLHKLFQFTKKLKANSFTYWLVVKADCSWPRGYGFELRHRLLDGCKGISRNNIKRKIENKGSQIGQPKKKVKFVFYLFIFMTAQALLTNTIFDQMIIIVSLINLRDSDNPVNE